MSQCPTCKGRKYFTDGDCDTCEGRGWVLDPEGLEAATDALYKSVVGSKPIKSIRGQAEAAVVAYLEKTQ